MKILWVSNAPRSPSGYGSQTRQVGRRLLSAGYEVEFSANDGTRGSETWEGAVVRGSGSDRYSRDKVREDFERSGADWAIVLYDPWVYTQQMTDPFQGNPRVAGWVPVDHHPVSPPMHQWLSQHLAIAMSRFGYNDLLELADALQKQVGITMDVRYAPHAIEPVFAPVDRLAFRQELKVPDDCFLVGIVAANIGSGIYDRKGFGDMLQSVAMLMDHRPDAYLYLHTLQMGYEGIHLPILAGALGIDEKRIRWADQYRMKDRGYSDEDMAAIYSGFDVLLSTSRGEGFGIPVIEAQACGTPVIVSNWTAQPELVGEVWNPQKPQAAKYPSGWVVSVLPDYDPRHASFFAKPNIVQAHVALEDCYTNHRGDTEMRAAAVERASEYGADKVFDTYWKPILAEMEARLVGPNRKQRRAEAARRRVA